MLHSIRLNSIETKLFYLLLETFQGCLDKAYTKGFSHMSSTENSTAEQNPEDDDISFEDPVPPLERSCGILQQPCTSTQQSQNYPKRYL